MEDDVRRQPRRPRSDELILADFTPREADVLAELQCGSSNKVIAGKLNLSGHTVKMHLQHIMRKLQVQNRTEVVARLGGRASPGNGATAT
ncbi:CsgBAC operon transcriptional regulatory protein [compost metagenome]